MSEAARAPGAHDEADGATGKETRDACDLVRSREPRVQMPRDRPRSQPGRGPRRQRVVFVQQHQEALRGVAALLASHETLDVGDGRIVLAAAEQDDGVGTTDAAGNPARMLRGCLVHDEACSALQFVEPHRQPRRVRAVFGRIREAGATQPRVEPIGVEVFDMPERSERGRELPAELGGVHTLVQRHDRDIGERRAQPRPLVRAPHALDLHPDDVPHGLGPRRQQPVHGWPSEPDQQAVPDRAHGRAPSLAREERHLADRLADRDVAKDDGGATPGLAHGLEPSGEQDECAVTRVALSHQHVAAFQDNPVRLALEIRDGVGVEGPEERRRTGHEVTPVQQLEDGGCDAVDSQVGGVRGERGDREAGDCHFGTRPPRVRKDTRGASASHKLTCMHGAGRR